MAIPLTKVSRSYEEDGIQNTLEIYSLYLKQSVSLIPIDLRSWVEEVTHNTPDSFKVLRQRFSNT
ncbi:hypothetical protein E2C01_022748 [Portunus trituberculatus]|uniref:Uncharacterized protein n=1 Tax=Portunus trituberculatus TaxID=210409 RepID=A0A5B7E668_PORTR|nr:hypothetical protein [Portunus trituberculatus]